MEVTLRKLESRPLSKAARGDVDACKQFCQAAMRSLDNEEFEKAAAQVDQAHGHLHFAEGSQKNYRKLYEQIAKDLQATRRQMFERDYPSLARREKPAAGRP